MSCMHIGMVHSYTVLAIVVYLRIYSLIVCIHSILLYHDKYDYCCKALKASEITEL